MLVLIVSCPDAADCPASSARTVVTLCTTFLHATLFCFPTLTLKLLQTLNWKERLRIYKRTTSVSPRPLRPLESIPLSPDRASGGEVTETSTTILVVTAFIFEVDFLEGFP